MRLKPLSIRLMRDTARRWLARPSTVSCRGITNMPSRTVSPGSAALPKMIWAMTHALGFRSMGSNRKPNDSLHWTRSSRLSLFQSDRLWRLLPASELRRLMS